jgi:pentatricopeptide repeat protein
MILQKLLEMSKSNTLEIAPMAQTYNLVLDSWAKSDRKDAADRALRLMREMHNAGISPDDCSYNSVLNAMAKHKDSESLTKAEALFEEMRDCEQSGTLTISEMTYNVMMNVYGKSSHKDGAKKAKGLLSVMESNGIQPTNVSYNSCIDAFAR